MYVYRLEKIETKNKNCKCTIHISLKWYFYFYFQQQIYCLCLFHCLCFWKQTNQIIKLNIHPTIILYIIINKLSSHFIFMLLYLCFNSFSIFVSEIKHMMLLLLFLLLPLIYRWDFLWLKFNCGFYLYWQTILTHITFNLNVRHLSHAV